VAGTLFVVSVVGKLMHSSSTWWAIEARYIINTSRRVKSQTSTLLTTALQTTRFSY